MCFAQDALMRGEKVYRPGQPLAPRPRLDASFRQESRPLRLEERSRPGGHGRGILRKRRDIPLRP
jgi:hypothetical protein